MAGIGAGKVSARGKWDGLITTGIQAALSSTANLRCAWKTENGVFLPQVC